MITSKKLSLALAMLTLTSATGYANVKPCKKPGEKTVFIETKKAIAKKHDFLMWRYFLNNVKLGCSGLTSILGCAGVAYSGASLVAGGWIDLEIKPRQIHPISPLTTLILSGALTYLASKVTQSAYDDLRDQLVESYFGITDPNQLQYHGEVESE